MDQTIPNGGPAFRGGSGEFIAGGPRGPGFGGRPRGFLMLPPWAMLLLWVVTTTVVAMAFWQIYRKAGYNGVLGLAMLIPGVNLVLMLWFAFAEWPVMRQLREARAVAAVTPAPAPAEQPGHADA